LDPMSLFELAYDALTCNDVDEKLSLTKKLIQYQGLRDMGSKVKIKKIQTTRPTPKARLG